MWLGEVAKRLGLSGAVLAIALYMAAAPDLAGAVSDEDLQKILQKVDQLTQQNRELTERVKVLEKQKTKESPAQINEISERVTALEAQETKKEVAEIKEDVSELSTLMTSVERKSLMDRVQFGAELRTRCDWFNYNQRVPKKGFLGRTKGYTRENDSVQAVFSNRFRLNMKTELTDNVQFTGRLTMLKRWNEMEGITERSSSEGRSPDDSDLVVERAYVDYFFQPHPLLPMALSFGRLPLSDGLPTDLREDTPRKSTYPALAWDVTGDGAGLSLMLDGLTGLKDSALRFIYFRKNNDSTDVWYRDSDLGQDDMEVFFTQFETMLPGRYLQDILFITNFLYLPEFPSIDLTSSSIMKPYDVPDSMGRTWKLTFLLEAKQYLGSNFDWFLSWSHSESTSTGYAKYRALGIVPVNLAMIRPDDPRRGGNGYCIYLGGRYTIPWDLLKNPKIGVEYNYGSKYWTNTNYGAEDPLRKLDTRGYCWDFYYIQPINRILSARLGYTWIRQEHPALGYEDERYMERISNTYLLLDAKF